MAIVLIYAQIDDPQVKSVKRQLEKKGVQTLLFERYRSSHSITYTFQDSIVGASIRIDKETYYLYNDDIIGVWYRPKPIIEAELPGNKADIEEQFCFHEWNNAAYGLWEFLSAKNWVNSLPASYRMGRKVAQLNLAQQCDLKVPYTIISNDYEDVVNFQKSGRIIYKTLSSFVLPYHGIFTTEVTKRDINPDEIAIAPGIFQSLIEKEYELRVIVVNKEIFVYKINSQIAELTKIDWRHDGVNEKLYSRGDLSEDIKRKLLTFHEKSGLIYAAYDFIVDTQGNEIFLECNPSGQWFLLEDELGLPISEAIASALIAKNEIQ